MTRPARIFCGVFAAFVLLLISLAGLALWLVATPSGLAALGRAADRWVPGLTVAAVEGNLENLRISGLAWESPGVKAEAEALELSLDWRRLFEKHLHLQRVALIGAELQVNTAELPPAGPQETAAPGPLDLHLPWKASVDALEVVRTGLEVDDFSGYIRGLEAAASLEDGVLELGRLTLGDGWVGAPGLRATLGEVTLGGRFDGARLTLTKSAFLGGSAEFFAADAPLPGTDVAREAARAQKPAEALPEAPSGEAPEQSAQKPGESSESGTAEEAPAAAPRADAFARRLEAFFSKPLSPALPEVRLPFAVDAPAVDFRHWAFWRIPGTQDLPGLSPLGVESLDLSLLGEGSRVDLRTLALKSTAGDVKLTAVVDMKEKWPFTLDLHAALDAAPWGALAGVTFDAPETTLDLTASGEICGRMSASAKFAGAADLTVSLSADPSSAALPFEAAIESALLKFPALPAAAAESGASGAAQGAAAGPTRVRVRGLALHFSGSPADWRFTLAGRPEIEPSAPVLGRKVLEGVLDAAASGNFRGAGVEKCLLTTPLGSMKLEGRADWSEHFVWRTALEVDRVDVGRWVSKLPLKLTAALSGRGIVRTDGTFRIDEASAKVDGTIQQAPVKLDLALSGEDGVSWKVPKLAFVLGRNTLDLKGEVEHLRGVTLDLAVNAPGLLNTIPGLKGSASGTVKLAGSLAHPIALANLRADELAWENLFALKALRLLVDLRNSPFKDGREGPQPGKSSAPPPPPPAAGGKGAPALPVPALNAPFTEKLRFIAASLADGMVAGSASLSLKGLSASGVQFDAVSASLKGTEAKHDVKLSVEGSPVSGSLAFSGEFLRRTLAWSGRLTSGLITTPAGVWTTRPSAALAWNPETEQFKVGAHCWEHADAEACLAKDALFGRAGEAALKLTRFDLSVLQPYLRKKSDRLTGALTGDATARWDLAKSALPHAQLNLNGDGLTYSTRFQGVRFPVTLEKLRAHGILSAGRLALAWEVQPAGNGSSAGELSVSDLAGRRRLAGSVRIDGLTPAFVQPYLSRGERAEGAVNADLKFGGTLAAPELYGRLGIENVVVNADFIPLDMEPSSIFVDFNGRSSTLSGEVRTKTERVALSGEAAWESLAKWTAKAAVSTEGLHVAMPPMINLDLKGHAEAEARPDLIRLTGRVEIPKSMIEVKELPASSVGVSSDQVLLDANLQPLSVRTESLPVESNLDVVLGDDVHIAAYGLKARLNGEVKLIAAKGRMGLLGQITIPAGRFRAYGQDLVIQTGQILFSGPMNNPGLRIEAVRNPENTADGVTAGIRVTGTAEAPEVKLFSTPQLSEEQALSYLLRGEGLGSQEGSSASMMTSMLIGLGTSQGGGILSEVGDAVGLRGLGVDTTGTGDAQKVVVTAYVLPGLQVKYGIGIFDSLATLTLRYRLLPRLYLEAASGVDQAIDFLYRFEF